MITNGRWPTSRCRCTATGVNVRDWLYVEDHCSAIDLIIRKGRVGEVYNIGGHNETHEHRQVVKTDSARRWESRRA